MIEQQIASVEDKTKILDDKILKTSETVVTATNQYSKRANRGYNPKYEQNSFVSFTTLCGTKRRQPENMQI